MVRNRPSRRRVAGWTTTHLLRTVRAFGALGQRRRYMAFFSIQERVRPTALSWDSTIRSSPPASASSETDFGADRVTSRPGR